MGFGIFSFFKNKWNFRNIKESKYDTFFSSKLSKWKFFILSYYFITMALCPYLNHLNSDFIELNEYSFYSIIFSIIFFNLFIFSRFVTLRDLKIDLSLSYAVAFFKNITVFASLVLTKISKWFFFTFFKSSKHKYLYVFIKSKVVNAFVIWRPLFKRLSYFGNFKLTRSKYNNLK